jgi:IclR family transcriptional regulator, KDG regulon repressor
MRTRRKNTLQTLEHAVGLLELLREHPEGLRFTELSHRLQLTKPSTFRILTTLIECRYLARSDESGKYGLGPRLWQLGCAAVERESSLREAAAPVLRQVAAETGETANLTIYDHGRIVYIDSVESEQSLRFSPGIGASAPAHCVASGKALLAFQPHEEIERVVRSGLEALTPRTIVEPAALMRELASIRVAGVSKNLGESHPGVGAIAVPIFRPDGRVLAAISVAGPLVRLSGPRLRTYDGILREAAAEVMRRIGGARAEEERTKAKWLTRRPG